jgi:hypothetical protein
MKMSFVVSFAIVTIGLALIDHAKAFQPRSSVHHPAVSVKQSSVMVDDSASASSPVNPAMVEEAMSIYQRKFPPLKNRARPVYKPVSFGMPDMDIDGTRFKMKDDGSSKTVVGTTFSERPESYLRDTFILLATIYGEEPALQMVQDLPICLAFDNRNFAPALDEFTKKFGYEESRQMIRRNPGLLAMKPFGAGGASTASGQTMALSYLVAVTRPVGPVLLGSTILLVLYPFIAALTGLPLPNH